MESQDFSIRVLTTKDIDALQNISIATFQESFQEITPEEDMKEYLETSFNPITLMEELKDKNSIFYFVENKKEIVGYGKINLNKPPYGIDEMPHCMEIQRIYILNKFQRSGAGKKLMGVFFEEAKKNKLHNIWLSTGAFNNKALNFYKKYEFEKIANHQFPVGNILFDDVILLLAAGNLSNF